MFIARYILTIKTFDSKAQSMSHVPLQVVPSLFKPYPGSQSQWKEPGVLTHTCRQLLVLDVAHSSLSGGDNFYIKISTCFLQTKWLILNMIINDKEITLSSYTLYLYNHGHCLQVCSHRYRSICMIQWCSGNSEHIDEYQLYTRQYL